MRIAITAIALLACLLIPALSQSQAEVKLTADVSTVVHTMQGGFGASWHAIEQPIPVEGDRSHGGSAWGANPPAEDARAWRQICRHADSRRWSAERGKPLFLSELGTMIYGWRGTNVGPSTWEAAIKDAELVVRALNLGVDGFNRWSFVNRGDLDGVWQMVDTWDPSQKALRKRFTPRPNA